MKNKLMPLREIIAHLKPGMRIHGTDEGEQPFSGIINCVHGKEKIFVRRDDHREGATCGEHRAPNETPTWALNASYSEITIGIEEPFENPWFESAVYDSFFPTLGKPDVKLHFCEDCHELLIKGTHHACLQTKLSSTT